MNIIQDFIPKGMHNRPGTKMTPRFITVHNTGNNSADALDHAKYLKNGARGREVSWHFTVDDKRIVQHLPCDEIGWHTGTAEGNRLSIGIEICEHEGCDYEKAENNAIELICHLMKQYNISLDRVVPHENWSGKRCPHRILPRWKEFITEIKERMSMGDIAKCTVVIDGKKLEGIIVNGTSYAPVRAVGEAIGRKVEWDAKTKTATLKK